MNCVTLANNHALDYGAQALLDTLEYLSAVDIACVGAGPDMASARAPRVLSAGRLRLAVLGLADGPAAYAAGPAEPGIAWADLRREDLGGWPADAVAAAARDVDVVLVSPHWGPNMTVAPAAVHTPRGESAGWRWGDARRRSLRARGPRRRAARPL